MGIMVTVISMMFYLGNAKPSLIEKELPAIINSYYVWDVYESEHMGSFAMLKFRPFVEMKKAIKENMKILNKAREYGKQ